MRAKEAPPCWWGLSKHLWLGCFQRLCVKGVIRGAVIPVADSPGLERIDIAAFFRCDGVFRQGKRLAVCLFFHSRSPRWDFRNPRVKAVIAFGGGDLPAKIVCHTFRPDGVVYTCPVAAPGRLLTLFLVPDICAIAPVDPTLSDENRQPLSYEASWAPGART